MLIEVININTQQSFYSEIDRNSITEENLVFKFEYFFSNVGSFKLNCLIDSITVSLCVLFDNSFPCPMYLLFQTREFRFSILLFLARSFHPRC